MPIARILVPLDGSHLAESVLPLAASLAGPLRATLVLVHIIEERPPQTVHGQAHLRTAERAGQYLADLQARYEGHVSVETHVHGTAEGNVAQSIADHVAELKADMVVLCTHGRGDLKRVVWGSIAQLVLRRVRVPVLLMRPQAAVRDIESVLVPIDEGHDAEAAIGVARELAAACKVPVHLVSVVPTMETLTGDRLAAARLTPISTVAALDAEHDQALDYIEGKAEELRAQGVDVETSVRRGEVAPGIAEAGEDARSGLVVVATHGRAGLDALFSGSVGQSLVNRGSLPVLLVKV